MVQMSRPTAEKVDKFWHSLDVSPELVLILRAVFLENLKIFCKHGSLTDN